VGVGAVSQKCVLILTKIRPTPRQHGHHNESY
jgi:hypothetical protein